MHRSGWFADGVRYMICASCYVSGSVTYTEGNVLCVRVVLSIRVGGSAVRMRMRMRWGYMAEQSGVALIVQLIFEISAVVCHDMGGEVVDSQCPF